MNRGFTLVELVVVILVVGILAVSIWSRTSSREELTLQARADQLASDIRYAQTLAMTTGTRHCLTLLPVSGPPYSGYALFSGSTCATSVAHPADLTAPISLCFSGTCVSAPALTNDYVQFDGLGTPYSASATALNANAVLTISDGGGSKSITISPQTGRVIVQ